MNQATRDLQVDDNWTYQSRKYPQKLVAFLNATRKFPLSNSEPLLFLSAHQHFWGSFYALNLFFQSFLTFVASFFIRFLVIAPQQLWPLLVFLLFDHKQRRVSSRFSLVSLSILSSIASTLWNSQANSFFFGFCFNSADCNLKPSIPRSHENEIFFFYQ